MVEEKKMVTRNSTVGADCRQMVRAELMGSHSHSTLRQVHVHVWQRDTKFLARGRYRGRPFGKNLGRDPLQASARLREILTKIDTGSYAPPSEERKQVIASCQIPRLTLREVAADFLAEKRKSRGLQTARDYSCRLAPVLDFAEKGDNLKRWPMAIDVNADFARSLRSHLFQVTSTRNGRPGGKPKQLSARQIMNILECFRTMLHWARSAQVRKLPADWAMPLTPDVIGSPPAKNPLREDKLPLDMRIEIVRRMDRWQQLACWSAMSTSERVGWNSASG